MVEVHNQPKYSTYKGRCPLLVLIVPTGSPDLKTPQKYANKRERHPKFNLKMVFILITVRIGACCEVEFLLVQGP